LKALARNPFEVSPAATPCLIGFTLYHRIGIQRVLCIIGLEANGLVAELRLLWNYDLAGDPVGSSDWQRGGVAVLRGSL
jgi:hypothetical protein